MKRAVLASLFAALAAFLVLAFAMPSVAQAQNKKNNKTAEKKKVKTYDFSGDDIDGDLIKPDGDFVDVKNLASHTSLIRIRKDFIKEILKSAEDL